jgi:hypothetical protein
MLIQWRGKRIVPSWNEQRVLSLESERKIPTTEIPMTKISVTASIVAIALLIGPIHSFERSSGTGGAASGPSAGSGSAAGSPSAGSAGAGTASVSGVPSGPANAGGLNNSGNDPSGAGNAAAGHEQSRHRQFIGIIDDHGLRRKQGGWRRSRGDRAAD